MAMFLQLSIFLSWAVLYCSAWLYSQKEDWNTLHATYCGGSSQSPINIVTKDTVVNTALDGVNTTFKIGLGFGDNIPYLKYKNDGTTLKMESDGVVTGVTLSGADLIHDDYAFLQFHSHWGDAVNPGSEHTIDGKRYPAEIHFVFISTRDGNNLTLQGDATVLGFFIDIAEDDHFEHGGNWDRLFSTITSESLQNSGTSTTIFNASLALSDLIPVYWMNPMKRFFRYQGSLTTPNCNEAVTWNVFQDPIYVSQNQYDKFLLANFADGSQMVNNYRPIQNLNGRTVYRSSMASVQLESTGWSYAEQDKWGDYSANCNGRRQSPIDIDTSKTVHDSTLDTGFSFSDAFSIPIASLELMNMGYTWQMTDIEMKTYSASDNVFSHASLPLGINDYAFFQFHYHWGTVDQPGSEHTINGKRYPAEIHFVFKSKTTELAAANSLAVLGFMIDIYEDNDNFEHGGQFGNILEAIKMLRYKGDAQNYFNEIALTDLLPLFNPEIMGNFYRYDGSLTTPTCNEVVNWFVFATPIYVSRDQYEDFLSGMDDAGHVVTNTYRDVQPLNDRVVYRSMKASNSNIAQLSAVTVLFVALASLLKN